MTAPPKHFRPAGIVEKVEHSPVAPPFVRERKRRGRRAAGIRYEEKIQAYLELKYGDNYVPSPWFKFLESGTDRMRWCQPDGILIDVEQGLITIVEVKLQHTSDAWWQLKWLYLPVLMKAFPPKSWKFAVIEITKWYDCATSFPEKVKLRSEIHLARPNEFAVHILKP